MSSLSVSSSKGLIKTKTNTPTVVAHGKGHPPIVDILKLQEVHASKAYEYFTSYPHLGGYPSLQRLNVHLYEHTLIPTNSLTLTRAATQILKLV
ncbi:hypothetical protein MA16_Dca016967 [Dendrobium catenatum]|uniref:Uncharacterized protein n=1 Tax=Dendrobium catenatum TaxID=906689 RepID=A0A2I0VWL8_9ASPA|nr:hypothetical protein MA16_Dca016967 [Dendrobium catenatum]